MFQKRHFEAVAGVLANGMHDLDESGRECVADRLADLFRSHNPRFKPSTFYAAAEILPPWERKDQACRACGREFHYDADADYCPQCADLNRGNVGIAQFVLEDFADLLSEDEFHKLEHDSELRRKLADIFLDGLGWHETASVAVGVWRSWREETTGRLSSDFDALRDDGYSCGVAAGSWVVDGKTSEETARKILRQLDEGDPAIYEAMANPLSGEWADDPTPREIFARCGVDDVDPDEESELLDWWQAGFQHGWEAEVVRSCRAMLGLFPADLRR